MAPQPVLIESDMQRKLSGDEDDSSSPKEFEGEEEEQEANVEDEAATSAFNRSMTSARGYTVSDVR